MAKQLVYTQTVQTTDAEFRAWGKDMSDALTAVGIPKTGDTGQIDWTTVTRPGTTNTSAGYEIRYLNDSMHGTAPVYIKLEWGTSTVTTTPAVWISTGSITNGAGTLSGDTTTRTQIDWAAASGKFPMFVSADASGFGIALMVNATDGLLLLIERALESDGDLSSNGYTVLYKDPNHTYVHQATATVGGGAALFNQGPAVALPRRAATALPMSPGNKLPSSGLVCWPGRLCYTRRAVSAPVASITQGTIYYLEKFGVTKPYMATGVGSFGARSSSFNSYDQYAGLLLLWED
jgi:hypothetical protein